MAVILISLNLCGCFNSNPDWDTVFVEDYGDIKFHGEWVVTKVDNMIYLTDTSMDNKDYKIHAVGSKITDDKNEVKADGGILGGIVIPTPYV